MFLISGVRRSYSVWNGLGCKSVYIEPGNGRNTFGSPHIPTSFSGFHFDDFGFFEGKFCLSKAAFFSVYDPIDVENYREYTL